MKRDDCILFSGAATGAESAFGEAAERRGIEEVNFTFEGHKDERSRGIRVLTHLELKQGDVSLAYVSRLMNRTYPDTPFFRKILQSIWHQVNNGQEIYVIGHILDDRTVKAAQAGARNSRNCVTNRYTSSIRKRTDGPDGPAMHGWTNPIPRSHTLISPELELEYFSRTGRRRSTTFTIDPSRK